MRRGTRITSTVYAGNQSERQVLEPPDRHEKRRAVYSDTTLLLIVALIAATLAGYMSGYLPYPFGIIVLVLFLVARLLYLHGKM